MKMHRFVVAGCVLWLKHAALLSGIRFWQALLGA